MAAKRECRLRLRKGEPLSFYVHTCITFLDLPRELRDRIYNKALVTPNPITVCSMTTDITEEHPVVGPDYYKDGEERTIHEERYIVARMDAVFHELALGLLRASKTIASEAAAVLYGSNTFHFGGTQVWNPFYGFLDMISQKNRSYLQNISIELHKPQCLNTDSQGIRTLGRGYDFRFRKVVSCAHQKEENDVYFVDPAIEACFRILGMDGSQLQLRLLIAPPFLPGVNVLLDSPQNYEYELWPWYSLDLPRNIETYRTDFASGVDVLWFGRGRKDMFFKQTKEIREQGWEVLETKDERHVSRLHDFWKTYFVLRRICSNTLTNPRDWSIDRIIEQYSSIDWPIKFSS